MDRFSLMSFESGFFTTAAFPTLGLITWKIESTSDLSLRTLSLVCTGVVFWLTCRILAGDIPAIIYDVFTMALAFSILAFKPSFND